MLFSTLFAIIPLFAEGATHRYELKVDDFDRLLVEDGINVEYYSSMDSAGYVLFESTAKVADQIIFDSSKKGRLKIYKMFHGEGELTQDLPVVKVYSRFLKRVQNTGDSTVYVRRLADIPEFKSSVIGNGTIVIDHIVCHRFDAGIKTGNGSIVVSGQCNKAVLNNTGIGTIQADNLKAIEVSCRFFGTGAIGVWCTEILNVKGMMKGKLFYRGDPRKIRDFSIGVVIEKIP